MQKLVLIRHGQSQWNLDNRFTGWVDTTLTEQGLREAEHAGQLLRKAGFAFERAYTSYLRRAIRTLWIVLTEMDQTWIPVEKHWRLNERHYGALEGLNKDETREKYGEAKVHEWRRSYATRPPQGDTEFQAEHLADRRYSSIPRSEFPNGEALKQTLERVEPYWRGVIAPAYAQGGDVLVAAHGNTLRALVKFLADMDEDAIADFEVPTGVPLVCTLEGTSRIQQMDWLES